LERPTDHHWPVEGGPQWTWANASLPYLVIRVIDWVAVFAIDVNALTRSAIVFGE
jgi:hypothetical protein